MTPVERALWFVESHFAEDITLADVAEVAGLSRHHTVRAFGAATGRSVMRHVRARRLTEAARALAGGAPDILSVALDAGYGSHEAFTRAFRDQFGATPEAVRARGSVEGLALVDPVAPSQEPIQTLGPPRLLDAAPLLLCGLAERFTEETSAGVPALWQRFNPHLDTVPGRVGRAAYGACHDWDDDGNFSYLAGVEVSCFSDRSPGFGRLRIPARRHAVFRHEDHVSSIRGAWRTIFGTWLPASGQDLADAPIFERYGEDFDPRAGTGGFEIWIPLKA